MYYESKLKPELQHFGVLGMRWGIRKDRQQQSKRISKRKQARLDKEEKERLAKEKEAANRKWWDTIDERMDKKPMLKGFNDKPWWAQDDPDAYLAKLEKATAAQKQANKNRYQKKLAACTTPEQRQRAKDEWIMDDAQLETEYQSLIEWD